jgi:DNA polymerase-3 subunit epsilon
VGKSKNLRQRVKSYFYGDGRKKIDGLLSEMAQVEGIRCSSELEALVLEARLIHQHEPKYNRRGKTWRRYTYLKIDPTEAYPRIKVVHETRGNATFLGPFGSSSAANLAKEALEESFAIRRCTKPMGASTRFSPCALADMRRCEAPCDGRTDPERYGELIRGLVSSLSSPDGLLEALESRMNTLAATDRFEEAASARDRLRALGEALSRRRLDAWMVEGQLVLRDASDHRLRLSGGTLLNEDGPDPIPTPCPRERADELTAVREWIRRNPVIVEFADNPPAESVEGGAALHRLLSRLRAADKPLVADRYR